MSALGFFRKNQKFVFWIMVVLMIAFAAGSGIERLGSMFYPDADEQEIGLIGGEKVTYGDQRTATQDLLILREQLQLGDLVSVVAFPGRLAGAKGLLLVQQNPDPALCWALLVREAAGIGVAVGDPQVDAFLGTTLGIDQNTLSLILDRMQREGMTQKDLRRAVRNFLLVTQAFDAAADGVARSEPELRMIYRDTHETMDLAMVSLPAADFLKDVDEPSQVDIDALYTEHRAFVAGAPDNPKPFKFGYRQPDAVQIEYAFVDTADILRSIEPTEDEILEYWTRHPGEFFKEVPAEVEPAATAPAEGEEPALPKLVRVPITKPSEARAQIVERLREEGLERQTTQIVEDVKRLFAKYGAAPTPGVSPLERAVVELRQAGKKIVYHRYGKPLTRQEFQTDPVLSSARQGGGMGSQGLVDLAFSVAELHAGKEGYSSPIKVGPLAERALDAVMDDDRVGTMVWRVVRAVPAHEPKAGLLSTTLYELGSLVERLKASVEDLKSKVETAPAAAAELAKAAQELAAAQDSLDEYERIQERVKADAKLKAAYDKAVAAARDLLDQAKQVGLHEAAKAADREIEETGPLPRQALAPNFQLDQIRYWAQEVIEYFRDPQGKTPPAILQFGMAEMMFSQALLAAPVYYGPPQVPGVETSQWAEFTRNVYDRLSLSTADTQPAEAPTTHPTSAPAQADSIMYMGLPAQQVAYVVQRLDFTPAYEDQYRQRRVGLLWNLHDLRVHNLTLRWYSQPDIVQRTGFQPMESD